MRFFVITALALGLAATCAAQTQPCSNPVITPGSGSLMATQGATFSQTFTANQSNVTWAGTATVSSNGTLTTTPIMPPDGLNYQISGNTVTISGTPQQAGGVTFLLTAVAMVGTSSCYTTNTYVLIVNPASTAALAITTASLPGGTAGVLYKQMIAATGGTPPYKWSVSSPPGATIDNSGNLSFTPSTAGTVTVTVVVADSAGNTATKTYGVVISPATPSQLTITSTSLPAGTVGQTYTATVTAAGGTPPYNWSAPSLAALGLTITGNANGTATISGVPTQPVTNQNVSVTVTDSNNSAAAKTFPLTINSGSTTPSQFSITTISPLPTGTVGESYTVPLFQSGGVGAVNWQVSGSLPPAWC